MNKTYDKVFGMDVLDSGVPVLVDFWATWCGPCKMLTPILDTIAETMGDKVKMLKLDVDENPIMSSTYGISTVPTVIIFNNGEIVEKFSGVQQASVYADALNKLIGE